MRTFGTLWLVLAALVVLAAPRAAHGDQSQQAVSAQDKATAREAAIRGIELYRAGDYAACLDKLQRAQALYDAPVHLLYIGRCQRGLNRWVEATETWRTLSMWEPPPGSPEAFLNAKREATQELAVLESQLPRLVIHVQPESASSLELRLDGAELPTAVVGIQRPTNPGMHTISALSPGFAETSKTFELGGGQLLELSLVLEPLPKATTPVESSPVDKVPEPAGDDVEPAPTASAVLAFAALRLGAVGVGGQLPATVAAPESAGGDPGDKVAASDLFKGGAELELQLGLQFPGLVSWLDVVGVHGFLQLDGVQSGSLEPFGDQLSSEVADASIGSLGVAISGAGPRDRFGGFGEVGVVVARAAQFSHRAKAGSCDGSVPELGVRATGLGVRLSGGVNIPLERWFRLTPYATLNVGGVQRVTYTPNECANSIMPLSGGWTDAQTSTPSGSATYSLISLGLGGEFAIGL